jgi:hypothetical protein
LSKPQPAGDVVSQRQDLFDDGGVVILIGQRPKLRGAGEVGVIKPLPKLAIVCISDNRPIAWEAQIRHEARFVVGFGPLGHLRQGIVGQPRQRCF